MCVNNHTRVAVAGGGCVLVPVQDCVVVVNVRNCRRQLVSVPQHLLLRKRLLLRHNLLTQISILEKEIYVSNPNIS